MKVAFTKPFLRDYQGLPEHIQQQIDAQIERLLGNPKHPSLGIWVHLYSRNDLLLY
jgi:mRNA-degrading endonuclease RelE of RelBE toxin-antitoxin system